MKRSKLIYLLLIPLFSGIFFQSCNNKDDEDYAEWKAENEAHIEEIKNNPDYEEATVPQGPGAIYYKPDATKQGNGVYPLYTDKVKVHYKGSLIDGTIFTDASERTVVLSVKEDNITVVKGLSVALQNMQVGEKWEIQVPWELGYGYSGYNSIPPYSALIFEVELLEIIE